MTVVTGYFATYRQAARGADRLQEAGLDAEQVRVRRPRHDPSTDRALLHVRKGLLGGILWGGALGAALAGGLMAAMQPRGLLDVIAEGLGILAVVTLAGACLGGFIGWAQSRVMRCPSSPQSDPAAAARVALEVDVGESRGPAKAVVDAMADSGAVVVVKQTEAEREAAKAAGRA